MTRTHNRLNICGIYLLSGLIVAGITTLAFRVTCPDQPTTVGEFAMFTVTWPLIVLGYAQGGGWDGIADTCAKQRMER